MALVKYTGTDTTIITVMGVKRYIKPNTVFSHNNPEYLTRLGNFEIIGKPKTEKEKKEDARNLRLRRAEQLRKSIDYRAFITDAKVSICIVTKDGYDVITRCLDSIKKYIKYPNFEVLLCDTGTTDENVFHLYTEYETIWDNFKVFTDHKYNFSKNNNFLAKQATGDIVLFLNNDVFFTYDAVTEMTKYALISNIGCVGHRLVFDRDKNAIQHDGQTLFQNGQWRQLGHHNIMRNVNSTPNDNWIVEGVTGACLMVKKYIFDDVGGFDEDYVDLLQDVDLNLKISKKGYVNFCIRNKSIIHVDHSSRKGDNTEHSAKDYEKLGRDWFNTQTQPPQLIRENDVSFLICTTKPKQLKDLANTVTTKYNSEIVFVDNRHGLMSASEALNKMTEVTKSDIIVYSHQDIVFKTEDPIQNIKNLVDEAGTNMGVLGVAGTKTPNQIGINYMDKNHPIENIHKVDTVDECIMVVKRSSGLKFGEYLDHFHFYGADLCCLAMSKGLINYSSNLKCDHLSGGGENLKGEGYNEFMKQSKLFYNKWKYKYPNVTTTTTIFSPSKIEYTIAKHYDLEPRIVKL